METISSDLATIANRAARITHDRANLPPHALEDLQQEALMWCFEHPGIVAGCKLPDGTYYIKQLTYKIRQGIRPAAETEARAVNGPAPKHTNRYTREQVGMILPGVWDEHYLPPRQSDGQGGYDPNGPSPHKYGTWATMRADVTKATKHVPPAELGHLMAHYLGGWSWEEIASTHHTTKSTAYRTGMRGMDRMLTYLNGQEPTDTHDVDGRHSVSNRHAAVRAALDYYGEAR